MIKLDVNSGVYTMGMWICLDETGLVFSWQGQSVDKPLSTVRPAALCRGETADKEKVERNDETELNGVDEELDVMSNGERDEIDGEEELAAPNISFHRMLCIGQPCSCQGKMSFLHWQKLWFPGKCGSRMIVRRWCQMALHITQVRVACLCSFSLCEDRRTTHFIFLF